MFRDVRAAISLLFTPVVGRARVSVDSVTTVGDLPTSHNLRKDFGNQICVADCGACVECALCLPLNVKECQLAPLLANSEDLC